MARAPKNNMDPDKLHVAMLGSMPPAAGISAYCLSLAQAVSRFARIDFIALRRLYPGFLHPGSAIDDPTMPDVSGPGLAIHRRPTWYNPLGWIRAGLCTPGALLHAQWWSWPLGPIYLAILLLFKLRKRPIVLTVHNVCAHEGKLLPRIIDRLVLPLADHLIVHSSCNAEMLRDRYGIAAEKISCVPHGALDFMAAGAPSPQAARARLGIPQDRRTVLCFGAIRPYKGLDTLIEAARLLSEKMPNLLLIIAGKCWEDWRRYQHMIDRSQLKDTVMLHLDFVPSSEAATYFQAAELVVLPYRNFDSQSGVGSLALATGRPLIVTNVGGLPELVTDARNVVPPGDAAALAECIHAALADPNRLAEMAQSSLRLDEKFSWANVAQTTLEVYRKVLAKRA